MVQVNSALLRLLPLFVCLFCLWAGALPALAATWQEHRDAGFLAFSKADYGQAVDHLKKAIGPAEKEGASAEELSEMLEILATVYFANGWVRPAQDMISKWRSILLASAGEPWVPEQRVDRIRLASLVSEVLSQREPATEMGGDTPKQAGEAPPREGDADVPSQTDEQPFIKPNQAVKQRPTLTPSSSNYAIHLESLKDAASVNDSWVILQESYPDLLSDKSLEVTEIDLAEQGTFYRIHAGFFATSAEAEASCEKLKLLDQYCKVIDLD